jgi:hypothetical protein
MKEANDFRSVLRWYPPKWKAQYGEGLIALLEDTYVSRRIPLRVRISLAKAGTIERSHEMGFLCETSSSNERLRAGSLLVLCAWSFFVVAGAIFTKFAEHWSSATPAAERVIPTIGYSFVQIAGIAGAVLVGVSGLCALPALFRLVRGHGWTSIKRPVLRGLIAATIAAALTSGLAIWARSLSAHQRNGGQLSYEIAFILVCLAIIATIAVVTASLVSISRSLEFSRRVLETLSFAAVGLTVLMAFVTVGTVTWWASEAAFAPAFLKDGMGSGVVGSSSVPPTMVLSGLLMLLGLFFAVVGSRRVFGGFRNLSIAD